MTLCPLQEGACLGRSVTSWTSDSGLSPACSRRGRSQVPLRKRTAGTGLQVALEGERTRFVGELHDNIQGPRTIPGGMRTLPVVVRCQTLGDVRCHTGVVDRRIRIVFQNVDESFQRHQNPKSKEPAAAFRGLPQMQCGGQSKLTTIVVVLVNPRLDIERKVGSPTEARSSQEVESTFAASQLRWTTFAWILERRLVDQTGIEPVTS